ncbi:MAG TPA: energy-coupling factor ABC transporter permease [Terriglobales bacterium]|nr:energy-coupling factor ABC transporter permease [Terriglobales bacterium]
MSHLHIPDGVLPWDVWVPGLAVALLLLVLSAHSLRAATRQTVAYQGGLAALVVAVMAIEVPLGPLEYHLTLLGPVGVLLGPAAVFQVAFVASAILALVGHGGLTVVGLNALVLGSGAALARPVYARLSRRLPVAPSMALATAAAQALSGALWLAVVGASLRFGAAGHARLGLLAGIAFPLWIAGVVVESAVAFGIARFVSRVRPDLLPAATPAGAR